VGGLGKPGPRLERGLDRRLVVAAAQVLLEAPAMLIEARPGVRQERPEVLLDERDHPVHGELAVDHDRAQSQLPRGGHHVEGQQAVAGHPVALGQLRIAAPEADRARPGHGAQLLVAELLGGDQEEGAPR